MQPCSIDPIRAVNSRKLTIDWPGTLLQACRSIEAANGALSLSALAKAHGVSASELQRQFTRRLGISPKGYAQALKLHRLARSLAQSDNALDAVYDAGFNSVSTAYSSASKQLGSSPARLRTDISIGWWLGMSDLGWMVMAATDKGICWLAFGDEPDAMLEEL
ncbi:MAG: helix-turn-helix domain-containing protein, partial [Wenzhouxiangella sp.]